MPLDSVKTGDMFAIPSKKKSEFEREIELFEASEREQEARLLASLQKHKEDKETNNPVNSSQPVNNNVDRTKDLEEDYDYFGQRTDSGRIRTPVTRLSQQSNEEKEWVEEQRI